MAGVAEGSRGAGSADRQADQTLVSVYYGHSGGALGQALPLVEVGGVDATRAGADVGAG